MKKTPLLLFLFAIASQSAQAALTPEEETLRLSKLLKPISDEEWGKIAGEQNQQNYEVSQGDTLWDVSGRLFGDSKYWPKVWAINNPKITNPHYILPGNSIAFTPGSGTSLPQIQVQKLPGDQSSAMVLNSEGKFVPQLDKPRSEEWRILPKQRWDTVSTTNPTYIDPQGIDLRSKVNFHTSTGYEIPAFALAEKLEPLGEIANAGVESSQLFLSGTVYIEAEDELQVGETYSLVQDANVLETKQSKKKAYSYVNLGKVKIVGVRDELYIGTLLQGKETTYRGALLVPALPNIPERDPIAGPSAIEGMVIIDPQVTPRQASQFKIVYVDRGSDDGVAPGMIFRAYRYSDPNTKEQITDSDFIVVADLQVLQVDKGFSTCIITEANDLISDNRTVVLLTDVSDLKRGARNEEGTSGSQKDNSVDQILDDLDSLDPGAGLNSSEERELKQLERWEKNPDDELEIEEEEDDVDSTIPADSSETSKEDNLDADPQDDLDSSENSESEMSEEDELDAEEKEEAEEEAKESETIIEEDKGSKKKEEAKDDDSGFEEEDESETEDSDDSTETDEEAEDSNE